MNNYIKNKNKTPKKISGRPEKLSRRNKRAIIRDVRKSISQIQLPGDINASRWTIWRTSKNCPNVEYSKGQKAPSWKEHHIKARFSWAKKYVSFGEKWSDDVFTDEKKWNLDGLHCYWNNLRKEKKIFKKRQSGGGSVMTWGIFCSNGIFKLVLVSGNMDSKLTCSPNIFGRFLSYCRKSGYFPTKQCPNSCVKALKSVFSDKNVVLMDWPPLSRS